MQLSKFGKRPTGNRLQKLKNSPNYRDGKFHNLSNTPQFAKGHSLPGIIYNNFIRKSPGRKPDHTLPGIKTDLRKRPVEQNVLVWFGHSSYYLQLEGKRILVDPVFSGNASPVRGINKSFKGTDIYTVNDFPDIDILFITHDHYDHLDYETVKGLKTRVGTVICSLGVAAHLEHWGYHPSMIIEKDWNETVALRDDFMVYVQPARHFSGRSFFRNNTLWCSFLLKTPSRKIFIGGDSGYDTHFEEIGNKFGPIDLVVLENGQYNNAWPYIHARPEEVLKAALDLQAGKLFPVHHSKFAQANHPWDEPLEKITQLNNPAQIPVITPMIGEIVYLDDSIQEFKQWWRE